MFTVISATLAVAWKTMIAVGSGLVTTTAGLVLKNAVKKAERRIKE